MTTEPAALSRDELAAIVRDAVHQAFRDVGLHAEEPEHLDEVRADFRFVRKLRRSIESTTSRVVTAFIVTIAGGAATALAMGLKQMTK